MKQIRYMFRQCLRLFFAFIGSLYSDLKIKHAELKYGGIGQIPKDKISRYLTPINDADFEVMQHHNQIKMIIDQICTHFYVDPGRTRLMQTYNAYIVGRCWHYRDAERMAQLEKDPTKHIAVWILLCTYGDISKERVEYIHPTKPMQEEWRALLKDLDQQEYDRVRQQ